MEFKIIKKSNDCLGNLIIYYKFTTLMVKIRTIIYSTVKYFFLLTIIYKMFLKKLKNLES